MFYASVGIVDSYEADYYTPWDNKTFTTLGYTNGPGGGPLMNGESRPNHTNEETSRTLYLPT